MNAETKLHVSSTPQILGQQAAIYVSRLAAEITAARGRFTIALSGGSLPKLLCPPLVAEPLRSQIDWSTWHVFWADERCVPLTHRESNYRLAREYFFDHVDIPATQIYPIDDTLTPVQAAEAYQHTLQKLFQPPSGQQPHFDLILLGMGEDGHTASLFPDHPLLNETERWVVPIFDSPKPPPARITLTLPVLNQARHVAFLATGASKVDVLPQVLKTEDLSVSLPAQMVKPTSGNLRWFVDEVAAAKLI
jgi:6-phosphogluconolactonase